MVRVDVSLGEAFRIFTEEIDQWWRRGRRFRNVGGDRSVIVIEPKLGGRLYESFDTKRGSKVIETGRVTVWEPPHRMELEWRLINFSADEKTHVEVTFEPTSRGTIVTVTHSGWSEIRADHPARHELDVAPFIGELGRNWGGLLSSLRLHAQRRDAGED